MSSTTLQSNLLTLPNELLLLILHHLPQTSFKPLAQTSSHLRVFIHHHGAHLCNTHIRNSPIYALASSLLLPNHIDGWLVPTHPSFTSFTSFPSSPSVTTSPTLSLATPGPHYLRFLHEYAIDIAIHASIAAGDVAAFNFALKTYCIKPFLARLNGPIITPVATPKVVSRLFGEIEPEMKDEVVVVTREDSDEKTEREMRTRAAVGWWFASWEAKGSVNVVSNKDLELLPKEMDEIIEHEKRHWPLSWMAKYTKTRARKRMPSVSEDEDMDLHIPKSSTSLFRRLRRKEASPEKEYGVFDSKTPDPERSTSVSRLRELLTPRFFPPSCLAREFQSGIPEQLPHQEISQEQTTIPRRSSGEEEIIDSRSTTAPSSKRLFNKPTIRLPPLLKPVLQRLTHPTRGCLRRDMSRLG